MFDCLSCPDIVSGEVINIFSCRTSVRLSETLLTIFPACWVYIGTLTKVEQIPKKPSKWLTLNPKK